MKEKIIAYLSGPRPYREGIALYEEYGLNLMLKASFRRNAETDLLRATLMEELRKLAGISETAFRTMQRKAVDSPHISSASIVVEEIKAEKTAVNVPVTPVVENVIRFRDRFPFLNIFQQHPFYFPFLQCPLMIGITPGKHILELPGDIGGQSHIHRPVIHRTKHTHIRGNRVPQQ